MLRLGRHSALLVLSLAAQVSYGQWDTNSLWPAWQHPRSTNGITTNILTRQLWQVYSALVERCDAVGTNLVSYPVAPGQTNDVVTNKSERAILIHYKDKAKTLLTNFLDHTKADSGGIYPSNATFQTWNVSNLSCAINIPSNYFDVTFWRFLSGLGVYEDTNVGHRVGYTNVYTQNAGTNFTGYRDKWYTTDYGVDELRRVIGQMKQTGPTNIAVNYRGKIGQLSAESTTSWTDAFDSLQAAINAATWDVTDWTNEAGSYGFPIRSVYGSKRVINGVLDRYIATAEIRGEGRLAVTNLTTNIECWIDYYIKPSSTPLFYGTNPAPRIPDLSNEAYYDYGTGWPSSLWYNTSSTVTNARAGDLSVDFWNNDVRTIEYPTEPAATNPAPELGTNAFTGSASKSLDMWEYSMTNNNQIPLIEATNYSRAVLNWEFKFVD